MSAVLPAAPQSEAAALADVECLLRAARMLLLEHERDRYDDEDEALDGESGYG